MFKRHVVEGEKRHQTIKVLQSSLTDLIDLALQLKQAHWNVVGPNFRSVHTQLDDIIADVRASSDEVAERIVTLADPADGRAAAVVEASSLSKYPAGFQQVTDTVTLVADRLDETIAGMRKGIAVLGEVDPVSEDLLIGKAAALEKHLWMVQAQEG